MRDKAAAMENEAKQKQLIYEAFECIQLALEIDDENFAVHKVCHSVACHSWMTIHFCCSFTLSAMFDISVLQ